MKRFAVTYFVLIMAAVVLPLTSLGDVEVRYFQPLDDLFLEQWNRWGALDDEELLEVFR